MPTVSALLVPKRESTIDLWAQLLRTRMLQVRSRMDSVTLKDLGHVRLTYGGVEVSCGEGERGDPPTEAKLPILSLDNYEHMFYIIEGDKNARKTKN